MTDDPDLVRALTHANRLAMWEADLRRRGRKVMADDVANMVAMLREMEPLAEADIAGGREAVAAMARDQRLLDAEGQTLAATAVWAGMQH